MFDHLPLFTSKFIQIHSNSTIKIIPQTVVWKNAVDSLEYGLQYLHTSTEARTFIERYMKSIISILLEQIPIKIGIIERNCVEASLKLSLQIIEEDIRSKVHVVVSPSSHPISTSSDPTIVSVTEPAEATNPQQPLEQCLVLDVLPMIFDKKNQYYKESDESSSDNFNKGLPEVRNNLILKFCSHKMFGIFATYLHERANRPQFPNVDIIHQILIAAYDALSSKSIMKECSGSDNQELLELRTTTQNNCISVCKAVIKHLSNASDDYLQTKLLSTTTSLNDLRHELQNLFDLMFKTCREETFAFYKFCLDFSYKLINSTSLTLKLHGLDIIEDLIKTAKNDYNPPPKQYIVMGAGTEFINGVYHFSGELTKDGYVAPGVDIKYEHMCTVQTEGDFVLEKAKLITLFQCTMRSQVKWWFLSEADEQQPGTDLDIDYYQHKTKKDEWDKPPPTSGWKCVAKGIYPPPLLEPKDIMVPPGEEYNTMEHKVAKWAIENKIVELILGNPIHKDIVARSIQLIQFLACMCTKDEHYVLPEQINSGVGPNAYCLQASHLTLAWNRCKSKLDPAAVSAEIYHLLVSILPSLPNFLAIHLVTIIQQSLKKENGEGHFFEVAKFCSTLAIRNIDPNGRSDYMTLSDETRSLILKLLWSVLTHPEVHILKCQNNLKTYTAHILQVEPPMEKKYRKLFLYFCLNSFMTIVSTQTIQADECAKSSRIVNLTQFMLEVCLKEQFSQILVEDNLHLLRLCIIQYCSNSGGFHAQSTESGLCKKSNMKKIVQQE